MESGRLWKLRVFELLYMIMGYFILYGILVIALWNIHSSIVIYRLVFIGFLLFLIKQATPARNWSIYRFVPVLRELKDYELSRAKLPLEQSSFKQNAGAVIIMGILVIFMFLLPTEWDPRGKLLFLSDWLSIFLFWLINRVLIWMLYKKRIDAEAGADLTVFKTIIFSSMAASLVSLLYFRSYFEAIVSRFVH